MSGIVQLSYEDLISKSRYAKTTIQEAFTTDGDALGILLIKDVPNVEKVRKLLINKLSEASQGILSTKSDKLEIEEYLKSENVKWDVKLNKGRSTTSLVVEEVHKVLPNDTINPDHSHSLNELLSIWGGFVINTSTYIFNYLLDNDDNKNENLSSVVINSDDFTGKVRGILYHGQGVEGLKWHCDYGIMTGLMNPWKSSDNAGGYLEHVSHLGNRIIIKENEVMGDGDILIQMGDAVTLLSGGRYTGTCHRVLPLIKGCTRIQIPTFISLPWTLKLLPNDKNGEITLIKAREREFLYRKTVQDTLGITIPSICESCSVRTTWKDYAMMSMKAWWKHY